MKDTTKDQSHDSLQLRNCLRCRLTSARTWAHLQICSYGETSPCKLRLGPWEISLPSQLCNHGGCRKCHECRQKICILYPMFTCEYSMSCVPRACVWAQRSQHRACHSVWRKRSEVEAATTTTMRRTTPAFLSWAPAHASGRRSKHKTKTSRPCGGGDGVHVIQQVTQFHGPEMSRGRRMATTSLWLLCNFCFCLFPSSPSPSVLLVLVHSVVALVRVSLRPSSKNWVPCYHNATEQTMLCEPLGVVYVFRIASNVLSSAAPTIVWLPWIDYARFSA